MLMSVLCVRGDGEKDVRDGNVNDGSSTLPGKARGRVTVWLTRHVMRMTSHLLVLNTWPAYCDDILRLL